MPNEFSNAPYTLVRQKPKFGLTIKKMTPEEEQAARDVEIQERGGHLHDTVKIDPFSKSFQEKEFGNRTPIKTA